MTGIVTVTCEITGAQSERDALVALMIRESDMGGQVMDFGRILPMPPALAGKIHGLASVIGLAILADKGVDRASEAFRATFSRRFAEDLPDPLLESFKVFMRDQIGSKAFDELVAQFEAFGPSTGSHQALTNFIETGYIDQHDWSDDHWGTRWNGFSLELWREVDSLRFRFVTDQFPAPVFQALAERLPNLQFVCRWQVGNGPSGEEHFNLRETVNVESPRVS